MSNPSVISLQLAAAVANGVWLAGALTGGTFYTPNGSLVPAGSIPAVFDVPRRVIITSAGNDSAISFWIHGTNRGGTVIWELVPGTNAGVAVSANDFATIIGFAATGTTASTVTLGTNGTGSSPWVLDNFLSSNWALSVWCSVVSGSATYTVEDTPDDPNTQLVMPLRIPMSFPPLFASAGGVVQPTLTPQPQQFSMEPASFVPAQAWPNGNLTGQTTNAMTSYNGRPVFAHRLTITAGTGLVVMQSIQSGIL